MMKNMKSLGLALLAVLLVVVSLASCGPTSKAIVTDADKSVSEIFDNILIESDGVVFGYKKNTNGGYDLMSLVRESGKLTVHGNTSAYVAYDKSLVFGPSIVIDGIAYVTTTSSERENEEVSFQLKGVDLFAFGKDKYLDYGRLFEENVTVEKLEEKDGSLIVYIEDAEELFDVSDMAL